MNSQQAKIADLASLLAATIRPDNLQAICDRYCELTGSWCMIVWNTKNPDPYQRFTILDGGQLNCLRLDNEQYKMVYCSEQPGVWLIPPERL